jgi:hypothetical protein
MRNFVMVFRGFHAAENSKLNTFLTKKKSNSVRCLDIIINIHEQSVVKEPKKVGYMNNELVDW